MENQLSRRDFTKLFLAGAVMLTAPGCGGSGGGGGANQKPTISLERSFENNGAVTYNLKGEDSDGAVLELRTIYNGESEKIHLGSIKKLVKTIYKKETTLSAISVDNNSLESEPLHDSFSILDRWEAFNQIKTFLDREGGFSDYESDPQGVPIDIANRDYHVQFLIRRNDNRFSVINYVSLEDALFSQQSSQSIIKGYRIDNLFLYRLPNTEIKNLLKDFREANYRTDFE